jgi:hypothetical protein
VEVDVVDHSSACDPAQVPAEVVALRPVDLGERADSALREPVDFQRLVVRQLAELAHVPVGGRHQVSRGIRKPVQQDECELATVHDELLFVGAGRRFAEHAPELLVRLLDVFEPPRRPELLGHAGEPIARRSGSLKSCT